MSYDKRWVASLGLAAAVFAWLLVGMPGGQRVASAQTSPANQCVNGGAIGTSNTCTCNPANTAVSAAGQGCGGAGCLGGGVTSASVPSNYPEVNGSSSVAVGTLTNCGCDSAATYSAINNYFLNNPANAQGVGAVLASAGMNCNANFGSVSNAALTAFLSTGGTGGSGLDPATAQAVVAGLNSNGVSDSDILATISNNGGSAELSGFLALFPCSDPIWASAASYSLTCSVTGS